MVIHKHFYSLLLFHSNNIHFSSSAELFLCFLEYYAEKFPYFKCAVAIHCHSPPLISQLNKGSAEPPLSSHLNKGSAEQIESCMPLQTNDDSSSNNHARFRESSLCVQDPFEHVHNVAKNMSKGPFTCFHQNLKSSYVKLKELFDAERAGEDAQDFFSLFLQSCKSAFTSLKPPSRNLSLTMDAMQYVLRRTAPYTELAHQLREIDVSNDHTRQLLSSVILSGLSSIVVNDFHFNASLEAVEQSIQEAQPHSPSPLILPSHSSMQVKENNLCQQRKRKHPTKENEAGLGDSTSEGEHDKSEGNKRQKLAENVMPVDELLSQLSEGVQDSVVLCTAHTETWVHCRRRKREKERLSSPSNSISKAVSDLADSLPSIPPCLVFTMALSEPTVTGSSSENTLTITFRAADVKYSHSFLQFFAFFKKWLLCIPS